MLAQNNTAYSFLHYRFGLFEVEERCFVTFDSDHLTPPLVRLVIENATTDDPAIATQKYSLYFTPDNENGELICVSP